MVATFPIVIEDMNLEDIDAVHVSRWTWDGRAKQRESDPNRRFAEA